MTDPDLDSIEARAESWDQSAERIQQVRRTAAGYAAAGDGLRPTVVELQTSALDLLDRLCAAK